MLLWKTLLRVYWWRKGTLTFVIVPLPVGALNLFVLRLTAQWHCLLLSESLIHSIISWNILNALPHLHHLLVNIVPQLAVIFPVLSRLLELGLDHSLALISRLLLGNACRRLNLTFLLLFDLL